MDAEAVGIDSAGTNSSMAATATGSEDSVITKEPACDMPAEIIPQTDSQPPHAGIQYSTDLRNELSLDVLASLGGPSSGDAKSVGHSIMDMASVRADMELISELSSLSLPLDHDDSTTPETLPPSSATPSGDPSHGSDRTDSSPKSLVYLSRPLSISRSPKPRSAFHSGVPSGNESTVLLSDPVTDGSFTFTPIDEPLPDAVTASLTSSAVSIVDSLSDVAAVHMDITYPVSSASTVVSSYGASTVVSSTGNNSFPVSLASTVVSSAHDSCHLSDSTADLPCTRTREENPGPAMASPPVLDSTPAASVVCREPVKLLSASPSRSPATDGAPAAVEACQESFEPSSSSSVHAPVSDHVARVSISVPSPLKSLSNSFTVTPSLDNSMAVSEPLSVALRQGSHTLIPPLVEDSAQGIVEHTFVEMQPSPSGDNVLSEAALPSLETHTSTVEPLYSAPTDALISDAAQAAVKGSHLTSDSLLHAVATVADSPLAGIPSSFTSASVPPITLPPMAFSFSKSIVSSALNPLSVPLDLPPPVNITAVLSAFPAIPSTPVLQSRPSSVSPPVSDAAPASFAPYVTLPTALPRDSVSSPHTARFWDSPSSSLSSGISLSVYFDGCRSPFRGRKSARKKKLAEAGIDLQDTKGKGASDAEKVEEVAELENMLEAQKRMVQWQIDEIQRIAALQCHLTGSNPLSEELAWEVLGVKGGGKKIGDSPSPETLRCLQEIFAIKDTLTKKEARDISFTSGASLLQVREFFAAQRSLVRKLVQQAHDEAGRLGIRNASEQSQQVAVSNTISEVEKDLGFDKLTGAESIEKLLEVMRAEKGFAGEVQLLQVILHTDSTALILRRFLEKGGLKVLGGWLVDAAAEQQISVLCHLLKVLDHLPMSNAVSHQMQTLVQLVNKLRFHRVTAVAGLARSLFTNWCKLFSPKTEGMKYTSSPGSKSLPGAGAVTPFGGLKRNRDPPAARPAPGSRKKKAKAEKVSQHEIKAPPIAAPGSPSLNGMTQGYTESPSSTQLSGPVPPVTKQRWSNTLQPSESAVAAVSVSRKRLASRSLGDESKDRLKDNHLGRNVGSKPAAILKNSRPLSTDDIYKAKKLERLMQEPVGKAKRRLHGAQEQSRAQSPVPQVGAGKSAVPSEHITLNLGQQSMRGGALTAITSKDEPETAKRTQMPTRIPENFGDMMTIKPASSQDLLSGPVPGDTSESMGPNRDSVTTAETDTLLSTLLGSSREELPETMGYGGASPVPAEVAGSAVADSTMSESIFEDASLPIHSQQKPSLLVWESKEPVFVEGMIISTTQSKPSVVGDGSIPSASSEYSQGRLEELSGLPVLQGLMNPVNKLAMAVTESIDENSLGQDLEKIKDGNPSPQETTLSVFYAALRASMVRWRMPPEYQPEEQWNVAAGEDSKENEVQSGRVKREEEAYYPELSAVPDDPKDPWEEEPNYDDSLTLEIFVESGHRKVLSEVNNQSDFCKPSSMNVVQFDIAPSLGSDGSSNTNQNATTVSGHQELTSDLLSKAPNLNGLDLVLQQLATGGGGGTHDPDLLAILLRNPELVSQLTSGQAFTPSDANPGVFMQPPDLSKQLSSRGNNGAGLSTPAGDLGQERLITSNNSEALGIPLQPGRSVSSVDQTPSETMRVQDSITMIPHPGMGQQQTMGFVPQGGVDKRLTPQMPPVVTRSAQNTPGLVQLRVPPPPPPLPLMQSVTNQALQPPLPSQSNKQSSWPEPQRWAGVGRPTMNPPQTHPGQEQIHVRPQTIMIHNARLTNYAGIAGVSQVEGGSVTSVVAQPEAHHNRRSWSNGSRVGPVHDNGMMQVAQESSNAGRNSRWPMPNVRIPDQNMRAGSREFSDFNNSSHANVVDSGSVWVPNDRTRPLQPPFQGVYGLHPLPSYPAPLWQTQDINNRPVQGGVVATYPHGRDLRSPQQQLWHSNMGPASRQGWRGPH